MRTLGSRHAALWLAAGCAALPAQTYTGTFQAHHVAVTAHQNCYSIEAPTKNITTASATISIQANCFPQGSIQGQITLAYPQTSPVADLAGSGILKFQSPFQATIGLSGSWTAGGSNYVGDLAVFEKDLAAPEACPELRTATPLAKGASNFSGQRPCSLNKVGLSSDGTFAVSYYVKVGLHASGDTSGDDPAVVATVTSVYTTSAAGPPPVPDPPADPYKPGPITDSRFVGSNPSKCLKPSEGPATLTVNINRVVGAVAGDGTLLQPAQLKINHLVSLYAHLRIPVFHHSLTGAGGMAQDSLWVNGNSDFGGLLTGPGETWSMNELDVPIEALHFGTRNPGAAPTAGQNQLQIQIDTGGSSPDDNWCTAVDWAELSFQAAAPVILIHGNGQGDDDQGGRFWAGQILGDDSRLQMPFAFIDAFNAIGMVYDNSISMRTSTIVAHGELLGTLIPAKAAEFGARHAHLVAHSKGGLDSRDFLARTIPPNFGVLSLTTLSTPHHGSAGPDYQIDAVGAAAAYSDDSVHTIIAQQIGYDPVKNAGTSNLRVAFVEGFNQTNIPLLPTHLTVDGEERPVVYQSFSADANLDDSKSLFGNPTISYDETLGIPGQGHKPDRLWAKLLEQVYRIIGGVVSTHTETVNVFIGDLNEPVPVKVVKETLSSTFIPNDFAVNLNQARIAPFTEIASVKANHSTIASPDVAKQVIAAILRAQGLQ